MDIKYMVKIGGQITDDKAANEVIGYVNNLDIF